MRTKDREIWTQTIWIFIDRSEARPDKTESTRLEIKICKNSPQHTSKNRKFSSQQYKIYTFKNIFAHCSKMTIGNIAILSSPTACSTAPEYYYSFVRHRAFPVRRDLNNCIVISTQVIMHII